VIASEGKPGKLGSKRIEREPGIEKSPQHHVSTDAGKAI
jgi:hypothetical protein